MECSICGKTEAVTLHRYDDIINPVCAECEAKGKVWRPYPDEQCLECGSSLDIYTDPRLPDGYGYDGDELRCVECGGTGQIHCDSEVFYAECPTYD